MAISYEIDPATALVRGYDRFTMNLSNWGNTGPGKDDDSTVFGPINFSCSGIAISPSSICYEMAIDSFRAADQAISPKTPWLGDIPGPWRGTYNSIGGYSSAYTPAPPVPASNTFGFNMGPDPNNVAIFGGSKGSLITPRYPSMILAVYLRPPRNAVPMQRNPMYDDGGTMLLPAGVSVQRVLAVPGRKSLRAEFRQSNVGSFDVHLGGIDSNSLNLVEYPLAPSQTLAANGDVAVFDILDLNTYWLVIKFNVTAGTPRVSWSTVAYDD